MAAGLLDARGVLQGPGERGFGFFDAAAAFEFVAQAEEGDAAAVFGLLDRVDRVGGFVGGLRHGDLARHRKPPT